MSDGDSSVCHLEDALAPTAQALDCAEQVLSWALKEGVSVAEVDADVLGGIAIWFAGRPGRTAWVACMNSGANTLVLTDAGTVTSHSWSTDMQAELKLFLSGDHGA